MGSPMVLGWIAHIVFWTLVVLAWVTESFSRRAVAVLALMWIVPFLALDYATWAAPFFTPYVALVDIGMVFALFKGDVRLT